VFLPAAACEQELAGFLAGRPDVVAHRLAGLLRQFKLYGSPSLSLTHGCPIGTIAVQSNVLDLDSDDIAPFNLLSMARLNIARSRVRCSIWSLVRIA
jgi:hypothetical protein